MAPGSSPTLSVSVGGQGRQLPVVAGSGATPTQNAAIPPGDELIRQMATADAPIALRFGDGTPLLLPQTPLIGEFAQICATGGTARTPASPAAPAGNNAADAPANSAAPANETAPAR
jgi:hypothetical protein